MTPIIIVAICLASNIASLYFVPSTFGVFCTGVTTGVFLLMLPGVDR